MKMFKKPTVLLLLATFFYEVKGEKYSLPPYITPCDYNNNFEKCVKDEMEKVVPLFTKGISELDIMPLDPVSLDDLQVDGNNLKLKFDNAILIGLGSTKIKTFELNIEKQEMSLGFLTDYTLQSKYDMQGHILLLPIQGNGDALIKTFGTFINLRCKLPHFSDENGDLKMKLSSPSFTYNITKTEFDFTNLFNGNKQLAETTLKFLNDNWRDVMDELAPTVIKQAVKLIIKALNKFLDKFPLTQLIKNYHE